MPETAKICEFFKISPLQLVSSGALLIAAEPEYANRIIEKLAQQQIYASVIGEFSENRNERVMIGKDGRAQNLPRPLSDHLWTALAR
jgi:hydrogenase maturation factor